MTRVAQEYTGRMIQSVADGYAEVVIPLSQKEGVRLKAVYLSLFPNTVSTWSAASNWYLDLQIRREDNGNYFDKNLLRSFGKAVTNTGLSTGFLIDCNFEWIPVSSNVIADDLIISMDSGGTGAASVLYYRVIYEKVTLTALQLLQERKTTLG